MNGGKPGCLRARGSRIRKASAIRAMHARTRQNHSRRERPVSFALAAPSGAATAPELKADEEKSCCSLVTSQSVATRGAPSLGITYLIPRLNIGRFERSTGGCNFADDMEA